MQSLCDCVCIKCLCASSRWEVLWRLCREFHSEFEQDVVLQTEEEEGWREAVGEEGWKEKVEEEEAEEEEVNWEVEVTQLLHSLRSLVETECPSFSTFLSAR